MSATRTLRRKINPDLLERVLNKTPTPAQPLKRVKPPRHASTYRAARRNKTRR